MDNLVLYLTKIMGILSKIHKAQDKAQPEIEKNKKDAFMDDYLALCKRYRLKLMPTLVARLQIMQLSEEEAEKINAERIQAPVEK